MTESKQDQPDGEEPAQPAERRPTPNPMAQEAEALVKEGITLCRRARWRDAIEPLHRALELDPTNAAAHYQLGEAYNQTDRLAEALAAYEAAARAQPTHWRALKGIGIILDRLGRPVEANEAYQRARAAFGR
ncbi:MAG TPA: tetratricopeptide repeat protein [Gemmatimonadaceae bacterium]|nr:tetratricopeptide repeat protein [Gemmatimonadaceae bacterium]